MNYFLSRLLSIIMLLPFGFSSMAQQFTFQENSQKDGLQILANKNEKIELEFGIYQFEISSYLINSEKLNKINYGLSLVPGEAGTPNLPFISKNILIPNGAQASLKITEVSTEKIENIDIEPSARIPFDTEKTVIAQKGEVYQNNENFPSDIIEFHQTEIRGMNFVQIAIQPFQFNPITKELIVSKNIKFEIELTGSKGGYGEDRFRSPYWDPIIYDLTFNSEQIPSMDYNHKEKSTKDEGCEYLIIVPDIEDYEIWADTIRKFRAEQGIDTKVMTISEIGGNDVQAINDFFEDVYNNWNPVPSAVLLMADYSEGDDGITSIRYTHPYEGTYITDNYYADVTNNTLPDFVFARMTARNNEELEVMVNKFLNYERTPPTDEGFYNNPITALGWQTERWFQICSETIGGYMSLVLGKTPNRINAIYDGNPDIDPWSTANNTSEVVNYFGPNGLNYIPATPSELGNWTGGTPYDIVDAINSGSFILQHRDHGYYGGWGEPAFTTSYITQLNNIDKLTHVFSINCQTGQFDVGENSFGEKFHRFANGGAVSVTAPTQVSYSFVNDALVWGIYDNMWPDFMPDYGGNQIPQRDFRPAFGLASGKYFLSASNWASDGMKTITYRLFHHHGDAFGNIYTEVPMENEVAHEAGITSDITNITVSASDGSLVGLSVDGEFLASGIVEDGEINLEFDQQVPGTKIKVVVTKQNYFRYEDYILVVPAEGPYVMKTNYSIVDENGNGEIDYNEEINVNVSVKNVGLEDAENIELNLSIDDEFIDIINGNYSLGSIAAGQEIEIPNAFTFSTAIEIPDMHNLNFTFNANNGTSDWNSNMIFTAYAPNLVHSLLSFEEIDGNGNDYLDPGETVVASFSSVNNGHRNFPSGESVLYENSEFISIDNTNHIFNDIEPDSSITTSFEITALESTPYASLASVFYQINAAPFEIEKEFVFSIGLIVEDWESETTHDFPWEFSGNQNWFITDDYTAEGDYSLKSGNIEDSESSTLSINYNVLSDHQISFFMQISSEKDHDFLNFYIDDDLIQSWSGLVLFDEFEFPVSEGNHTFSWEYIKDEEESTGLDAAWIDYIIFPPGNTITGLDNLTDVSEKLISIYPNPAINNLYIKTTVDNLYIEIYNLMGEIYESNQIENKLDLKQLSRGVYFIKASDQSNNKSQILKFIKL